MTTEKEKLKSKTGTSVITSKYLRLPTRLPKRHLSVIKMKFENEKAEHRKRIKSLKKVINGKL